MVNNGWTKPKAIAAFVFGSCVIASLLDQLDFLSSRAAERSPYQGREFPPHEFEDEDDVRPPSETLRLLGLLEGINVDDHDDDPSIVQRELQEPENYIDPSFVYPWAKRNVLPVSATPDPSHETTLYWNIPMSKGPTAKDYFRCLGARVDVQTQMEKILRSKEIGLVQSGQVDVVFSSSPHLAIEHLFDPNHMARVLALFRHPVHRLIDKFHYLQVATWENAYKPEWIDMDLLEWVENHNSDNNMMVKKLAGKIQNTNATKTDLLCAKKTMRQRFVVGLVQDLKESFRRFNTMMGVNDETNKNHKRCTLQFFGKGKGKPMDSESHPKVDEDSPAWKLLVEQNALDIQLYEFIVELFEEQKKVIHSYARDQLYSKPISKATPASQNNVMPQQQGKVIPKQQD
eukprot:CAMPEP_0172543806 /NCGR_PEP_ID=MMETSP1067-20121228/14103_1 /TAXON_ID=265564 ORGANISM="Thalassiosira punctigera, Strain Tpunct2005C2" /NCGR_SAMPLE_ID=MMETSP1067 /ASSEMBLY_ACC=CAM_ASM_000444 /LENGTH=400 /DNA_ID=CAMNT_0013330281 /DNA_START=107 /DNA_END=1309 /DNA_ORIENTATION=-